MLIKIAGILRKSPTKSKNYDDNIKLQKDSIQRRIERDFENKDYLIEWFVDDHVSGDDPNRPELLKLFDRIDEFKYAYCDKPDRFSRFWLGLKWFMENFTTEQNLNKVHKGCKLRFVEYIPELYNKDDTINMISYSFLWDMIKTAMVELLLKRNRQEKAYVEYRKDPEKWKKMYPGRKKGAKNKKKSVRKKM